MKLNKNSWHYKMWANSFDSYDRAPLSTDLCRYCHKVFWQLFIRGLMVVMVGALLWMLGYGALYQGLFLHTKVALIIGGTIAAVLGAIILYARWLHGGRRYSEPKTLVGKYARAAKQGICPMVDFTEED